MSKSVQAIIAYLAALMLLEALLYVIIYHTNLLQ